MRDRLDAETIAKGLSEAQKRAVLGAIPDGHLGHHFIRRWNASGG